MIGAALLVAFLVLGFAIVSRRLGAADRREQRESEVD